MKPARSFALAPLQIAQALVGFGAIAAFTRLMSPQQFGDYALALSVSMFIHTLVFTWIEAAAFRFFAASKAQDNLRDHFATLTALALAAGGLVLVATTAVLFAVGARADTVALSTFAAGAAVFRVLTRISRENERADLDITRYAAAETAYLAIGFAAGIALLLAFHLGAAAPFAGALLGGAVMFAVDAPRLLNKAKGGTISTSRAASYVSYGAPLALALALDLGVQTLARFLIASQASTASLGAYVAAFGLARPIDLIFISAGAALSPLILANYEHNGVDAAEKTASDAFALMAALAAPATIGLVLLAHPITTLMIGGGLDAEAARALPWLALAGLLSGFNVYFWSEAFQLARRTGLRMAIMIAPGAVQIATIFWLAPTHGALGAAIAAAAGAGTGALLLAVLGRRLFAPPLPWPVLARIALACGAMTIAVMAGPRAIGAPALATSVGIGVFAYSATALALNLFGAHARMSAVSQALAVKLGGFIHVSFTDRSHARARR